MCRLNFQDNVREEERRCLLVQYDVSVGSGQYQMLQCSYAHAETLIQWIEERSRGEPVLSCDVNSALWSSILIRRGMFERYRTVTYEPARVIEKLSISAITGINSVKILYPKVLLICKVVLEALLLERVIVF
ncbi:hypothetical protein CLV74_11316 [Donghicola tyrosinivorans]|uniref:Uncharacterized protein n=1 Tax=Donghicola tyrosinivorans TaxID=1652492 RepID=A0A2T0WH54_9RHOB|nr:hypothetical protein CLV74_11316 [Donghicola tyrosinivorans]